MTLINHSQLPPEAKLQPLDKLLGNLDNSKILYRSYSYLRAGYRVIELEYLDATHAFIKFSPGGTAGAFVEVGGTEELNTGTKLAW